MIRSALEILGWYLSPRRLPWFAIVEFALWLGGTIAYLQTESAGWLVMATIALVFGIHFAAQFYAHFDQRPETKRERRRAEARIAEWVAALSDQDRAKLRRLNENAAALVRATGVDAATAMANMRSAVAALNRSS